MADKQQQKGKREFGGKGGDRKGQRSQRRGGESNEWKPVTKLGRLVKAGKITSLEEIFRFAIPIKETEIIDFFLGKEGVKEKCREECVQIKPVQKQTKAGQRTRFKAYMCIGDADGHVGLGWKCAKEVQGAIKGAILHAKQNFIPVRRGYWGNKIGNAHTIPTKVTGKSGSVRVRLIPAPRGTGLVAAPASKKIFQFAGIGDVFTSSRGSTRTKGNFIKAAFYAVQNTYNYLTPDFWGAHSNDRHPFEVHNDFLNAKQEKQFNNDRPRRPQGGNRDRPQRDGQRRSYGDRNSNNRERRQRGDRPEQQSDRQTNEAEQN